MKKNYTKELDITGLPQLTQDILTDIGSNGIVLLRGNLASGKTSFVVEFAKMLGVVSPITSPTFSILHEYDKRLFHYDIYQCGNEGFLKNGLIEKLDEDGYHLIEWGDSSFEIILQQFGLSYSTVDIETIDLKRKYKVNIDAYA